MTATEQPARFRDQAITFANRAKGIDLVIPSASPRTFHQAISDPGAMPAQDIDGKLFLPVSGTAPFATVIVVPGSLGVAPSHLAHAETLNALGFATLVIDPFGPRGVTSTVTNQVQYSFAASAFDVLASVKALSGRAEIDAARIGAQGHSRGGAAVMMAAMRRLADPVLGDVPPLRAIYAAYPWCGHQFLDPDVGATRVRAIIGDRDGWCSPQQVQGQVQAIRLRGGDVSLRIVPGAAHSFDRETAVELIADAAVAPGAPTAYIADDGAFIHPATGETDPALTDRDLMVYGLKAGYGVKGATIGTQPGQSALFREDMVRFWTAALR
jgi:dienelactone hydrolase